MKLSKSAAQILGRQFAESLHDCGKNTAMRQAVYDVKNHVADHITIYEIRTHFFDPFYQTLDVIEPQPNGFKWAN